MVNDQITSIDFERRIIRVERSFNKPTKTGKVRYVPILDPILPVLQEWKLTDNNEWVVPNRVGKMHLPADRIFQETLKRCLIKAELPKLRFHDLRHSFASLWVKSSGDIFRLQKILGHASIMMTQRYAHLAPDVFIEDFSRLGQCLQLTNGEIVELEKFKQAKGE